MKNIRYTTQYKKDLKRILNQPKKLKALQEVIDKLRNEISAVSAIQLIIHSKIVDLEIEGGNCKEIFCKVKIEGVSK